MSCKNVKSPGLSPKSPRKSPGLTPNLPGNLPVCGDSGLAGLQYTCMPNGYKDAPRLFTKLLKVPLSKIRKELKATIAAYLDDSLGIERGVKEELRDIPHRLIQIFQAFGYTINFEKSSLDLTKTIEFLGFIINSIDMTVSLSEKKTKSVRTAIREILHKGRMTIREVSRVIGKIIATMPANRFARRFTTRAILLKA